MVRGRCHPPGLLVQSPRYEGRIPARGPGSFHSLADIGSLECSYWFAGHARGTQVQAYRNSSGREVRGYAKRFLQSSIISSGRDGLGTDVVPGRGLRAAVMAQPRATFKFLEQARRNLHGQTRRVHCRG